MLQYRVFTATRRGEIHYGSARVGVPATSTALGAGARELCMIADAHGLCAGSLIYIGNRWLLLEKVEPGNHPLWPVDISWKYLPTYEDTETVFGDEHWSLQMIKRLTGEAIAMEKMK